MNEKIKGVSFDKRSHKYVSYLDINSKRIPLGSFKIYEEAVDARKAAEIKYGFVHATPPLNLKHRNELTQEILKEQLHYDPETGHFTWKVRTSNRVKIGSIAGSLHKTGYIQIRINKKQYLAHRLAFLYMNGKFPEKGLHSDHINHIRSDNRWVNLRIVTQQDNLKNKSIYKNNKAGHVGVHWDNIRNKWVAQIKVNGESVFLGRFDNVEDAIACRKEAEIKFAFHNNHGTITKTN